MKAVGVHHKYITWLTLDLHNAKLDIVQDDGPTQVAVDTHSLTTTYRSAHSSFSQGWASDSHARTRAGFGGCLVFPT